MALPVQQKGQLPRQTRAVDLQGATVSTCAPQADKHKTLGLDGSGPGQGAGPELQVRRNNLEALDLLKISIMKRPRSFEAVDGDTATALFHVLKPHGASGADIYGNVCMKTGIDLKQLQAQEETLFDLVHLQTPRYCQWARDGHRNRWEAQEDDLHSRSG